MYSYCRYLLLTVAAVVVFNACSLQKRVYLKGYHIVWNKKKGNGPKQKSVEETEVVAQKDINGADLIVTGNNFDIVPLKKQTLLDLDADTCGDAIFLKNGEKIVAKISEITDSEIKYKRCDYLSGPNFILKKSKVALIQFSNGIKETIDVPEEIKQPVYTNQQSSSIAYSQPQQQTNGAGLAAFICAMAGLFLVIPYIAAIPLGIISLQQFSKNPGKYKDKWMPITALGIVAGLFILVGLIVAAVGFFASEPQVMAIGGGIAVFGMLCLLAILIYD